MAKYKNLLFYIGTIAVFSILLIVLVQKGSKKEVAKLVEPIATEQVSGLSQFQETIGHNLTHPLSILLLQIITIIFAARLFGYLCKKIGQPMVIGEIIAGIVLGPSLIGHFFPEFSSFLFPPASLGNLQFLSQIGLILFMFVIGMELDLKVLKNQASEAVVISHASIIIPFALGTGLSYFIYDTYAGQNVRFLPFALFVGIAMSVTAFPVLARIVQERGLSKTRLGTVVITCAAADDITAWCILAAVIAIVKAGSITSSAYTILMAVGYVMVMLKLVQPFLKRLGDIHASKEGLSKPVVAIYFVLLLVSAYLTEVIGIHALFGAFMAGVIMPDNERFRNIFIEKVEDVAQVLLLPLFFVFTGLRTQIGLLNQVDLWQVCGWIILVAVMGKFMGSALAARFVGQNWRDSLIIGALMNTRGLMELVVLNIGYDLGVLTPEVFAMMVIMALVTTFMTGPALSIIHRLMPDASLLPTMGTPEKFDILISFANPATGRSMLRLANSLTRKTISQSTVTALHVSLSNELNPFNSKEYERDSFQPIEEEAKQLRLPVSTVFKPSQDINSEIVGFASAGKYDLLLIGMGNSVFEGTFLGKVIGFTSKLINPEKILDALTGRQNFFGVDVFDERTTQLLRTSEVPIGVLIDKGLTSIRRIYIILKHPSDRFLLDCAKRMMANEEVSATVHVLKPKGNELTDFAPEQNLAPFKAEIIENETIVAERIMESDLLLIGIEAWKQAVNLESKWLVSTPSVLILKVD